MDKYNILRHLAIPAHPPSQRSNMGDLLVQLCPNLMNFDAWQTKFSSGNSSRAGGGGKLTLACAATASFVFVSGTTGARSVASSRGLGQGGGRAHGWLEGSHSSAWRRSV